nr:hypothetical protein [Thioalkalivibrio sp. ALJ1]
MAQHIFTMNGLGKIVPPKKYILKDINLNFFPAAKIGVLGYNGASTTTPRMLHGQMKHAGPTRTRIEPPALPPVR